MDGLGIQAWANELRVQGVCTIAMHLMFTATTPSEQPIHCFYFWTA